tara:strand:- start:1266 stop:2027 length:762 start_codon:yes stop_codon:yes gene_type:complete
MRPYILAESNWNDLKDFRFDLAVLPWGATEAHNYHLPYGTDIYEADHIAAESGKKAWNKGAKVTIMPTIPYGVNTGQSDIYLDMNINPSTQLAILDDVVATLSRQGLKKLLIFNSHGGNNFKPLIRELGLKYPDMFISLTSWFQAMDRSKYFEEGGDHAEEMETSLILHFRPDLVLPKDKWGAGHENKSRIKAIRDGHLWAERQWSKASPDTGIGSPMKATFDKGKRFFEDVTDLMAEMFMDLCQADLNDLYE